MAKKSTNNPNEVIPSASRLVNSLRDLGYDFVQAVADVVDNSLAAGSSRVDIDVTFNGAFSFVRIADNGCGMSRKELLEAMRFGSNRDYDQQDLGRFGLGLKTASLSQCRRLAVATRDNPTQRRLTALAWDLDHLERTNRWEVLPLKGDAVTEELKEPLEQGRGTVVLWRRLDRVLDYAKPNGEHARRRVLTMCRELEAHLAMVFHRFLSGETKRKKLVVTLNGNRIEPWDPFARDEPNTKQLKPVEIPLEYEGVKGVVRLERYILPHESEFSSSEAFRLARGPDKWNQQQGFYIYRANRLLQSGGWSGIRARDEHTKLARCGLYFLPKLDAAFQVNVAKMRVQLPPSAREEIKKHVQEATRVAQNRYRNPAGKSAARKTSKPAPAQAARRTGQSDAPPAAAPNGRSKASANAAEPKWTIDEFEHELLIVAKPGEKKVVRAVVDRLRKQ